MFTGKRYITVGVHQSIPLSIQELLWELIDDMSVEKDYLQVFQLTVRKGKQEIEHSQEQPLYNKRYVLKRRIAKPMTVKIYVIDSDEYSTMLLASEY